MSIRIIITHNNLRILSLSNRTQPLNFCQHHLSFCNLSKHLTFRKICSSQGQTHWVSVRTFSLLKNVTIWLEEGEIVWTCFILSRFIPRLDADCNSCIMSFFMGASSDAATKNVHRFPKRPLSYRTTAKVMVNKVKQGSEAWCIGSVRAYGSEGPEFEPRCWNSFFSGGLWRDLVSPSVWGHNCRWGEKSHECKKGGCSRRDLKYKGDILLGVPKIHLWWLGCPLSTSPSLER